MNGSGCSRKGAPRGMRERERDIYIYIHNKIRDLHRYGRFQSHVLCEES